jgi:Aldehyde oxidase and xanthine dehydrogenase, a/b hammerhead domain
VTGGARYTADIPLGAIAHAAIVYSTVANGRTVSIDTQAVEKAPGVVIVLTHKNMPRMKPVTWSHLHPQGQTYLPLQDDRIHYAGQPVALVVAATLDQATYAGTLIKVATKPTCLSCLTCGRPRRTPSSRRSACGRSLHPSAMPTRPSRTPQSKSSRPIRCLTVITIRWSRT